MTFKCVGQNWLLRKLRFWCQRRTRGWDDSKTWSLDWTIAKFILPRLKRFRELNNGHPGDFTEESWNDALDKMIDAMEFFATEQHYFCSDKKRWGEIQEGLDLFAEWFADLWW